MNINLILKTLGLVLLCEAAAMVPSLLLSLYDHDGTTKTFIISIMITGLGGLFLGARSFDAGRVGYKEGFLIATLSWLLLAVFGAIPFVLSGVISHPVDAFFETMSGFTTTGASVITDVELLSRSILFWRSITQWLGGMGVIVLTLALIPSLKIAGMQLYKAEFPGPNKTKMLPRIAQTSRQLYKLYLMLTVVQVLLLKVAGMTWFDSFIHTFGSVATGGFSNKNASVAAYDSFAIEMIITVFMIICGINFALHFYALRGKLEPLWKDSETRLYLGVIAVSTLLIAGNLSLTLELETGESLRQSLFQVASIVTTTGYASADFESWPSFSKIMLLVLMFIGGCAGSTSGSIKNIRHLILLKGIKRQIIKLIHPQAVVPVRVGSDVVNEEVVGSVQTFFFIYFLLLAISTIFITSLGLDIISSLSAVAATLGNVGPGFGQVGPMSNYAAMPVAGKIVLSLCMLVGRLEIYTVLVVFSIRFWRS